MRKTLSGTIPRGIVPEREIIEVCVRDRGNSRIQVLSILEDYVCEFGRDHLTEPCVICYLLQCILKFSMTGEFL